MVTNKRHPDQGERSQSEGEDLGQTKGHALEDEELASKMSQRNHVGPVRDGVDGANVQVVGSVASHDAGDEGPGTKQPARERGHLVGGLGVILG